MKKTIILPTIFMACGIVTLTIATPTFDQTQIISWAELFVGVGLILGAVVFMMFHLND